MVFFDLPVTSKKARKKYTQFRRFLLNDGYDMIQYSVYSRVCNGLDSVNKYSARLENKLPRKGSIRTLVLTDKQYCSMKIHIGLQTNSETRLGAQQMSIF